MRDHKFAARLVSFAVLAAATVTPAGAMTLQDALGIAYADNPAIRAERAGTKAADAQVWEAGAGMLPTVTLQGTIGKAWYDVEYSDSFTGGGGGTNEAPLAPVMPILYDPGTGGFSSSQDGSLDIKTYGATVEQVLFTGGRAFNAFRQVRALSDLAGYQLLQTESQVLLEGVTSFMDVITNDAVVALSETNVDVLKEHLSAAQTRFEVGEITRTDVAQAEARLAGVESALSGARAQARAARKAFVRVFGRSPDRLEEPTNLPPLPKSEQEARDTANSNSPILNSARAGEDAASRAVWVARGEFLPTVALRGEYTKSEGTSPQLDTQTNKSIMAVASWPIFEGGASYARNRKANYEHQKAKLNIYAAERQVEELVAVSWENLTAAQASIRSDEAQVRAQELALQGVRSEAQVGSRSTLDVLNAEQELLNARVALVRSRRNEVVAAYQLLTVTGLFTPQYVGFAAAAE